VVVLLATTSGCVGHAQPLAEPTLQITIHYEADGIRIVLHVAPESLDALRVRVRVDPSRHEFAYNGSALLTLGGGAYEIPKRFPADPAFSLVIGAAIGKSVSVFREIHNEDLGIDQQRGMSGSGLRSKYAVLFAQRGGQGDAAFAETQSGTDVVSVSRDGKTTRSFDGSGTFDEALDPLRLHLTLDSVSWIRVNGVLSRSVRSGHGTWDALAPADGQGTISSFRQEYLGQENLALGATGSRPVHKETVTAVLNGTFAANGTSKQISGSVFWTQWTDVETHKLVWLRQRPGNLLDMSVEGTRSGTPRPGIVPTIMGSPLQGRVPVPAQAGDEFTLRLWGENAVRVKVGQMKTETIAEKPLDVHDWDSDGSGFLYRTSASQPNAGMTLHWRINQTLSDRTISLAGDLAAMKREGW
jgi:hypothetical protein